MVKIIIDVNEARKSLTSKALKKLRLAANILKRTADLYDGDKSVRPLWAAGVVTHGQPKNNYFEIGVTTRAEQARPKDVTLDHLFRVTETADFILRQAASLSEKDIEDLLISRSIRMRTTRQENHSDLKKALKQCSNTDDWQELYEKAGVPYRLYTPEDKKRG